LNNVDVGGRPLRIDLADSDPFLEGKTTVRGEILDGGGETRAQWRERERRERDGHPRNGPDSFLQQLPPGTPPGPGKTSLDAISHTLATMNPSQLTEVLAQMKVDTLSLYHLLRTVLNVSYEYVNTVISRRSLLTTLIMLELCSWVILNSRMHFFKRCF
jgi:cleavage stimulation factor subunit 2